MHDTLIRHLTWDACYNIRDLGGYTTPYGTTQSNVLVRGDSLIRLSPAGCHALRDYGIRTVIDLRSSRERAAALHPFAYPSTLRDPLYRAIPLFDESNEEGIAWVGAARTLAELYETILAFFPAQIVAVLRAIANAPSGGILFHCHAGKDRTGLIAMFLLAIAGASEETIVGDYALSDQFLGELHEEILARYAGEPAEQRRVARLLHSRPEYMLATLERLNLCYNGPLGYLQRAGLTEREIHVIRKRLL
jgi:protein-tyrosine phosphatase